MTVLGQEDTKKIIDILGIQRFLLSQSNLEDKQKRVFFDNITEVIDILTEGKNNG